MFVSRISLLALVAVAGSAVAAPISVPLEFGTIQDAIEAAQDGDEILIAPGVYSGSLQVNGKRLSLRGLGTTASDVTIVGTGGSTVRLDGFADVEIANLTITGGLGTADQLCGGPGVFGGGLFVLGSAITLQDVDVVNNQAEFGGGLWGIASTVTIRGGRFAQNQASILGAAISLCPQAPSGGLLIEDTAFEGNVVPTSFGIIDLPLGTSTIRRSTFTSNSGTAIRSLAVPSTTVVESCTFTENTSNNGTLGFITLDAGTELRVADCTFVRNEGGSVGGLFLDIAGGSAVVTGTTFEENGGTAIFGNVDAGGSLVVNRTRVDRNSGPGLTLNTNLGSTVVANTQVSRGNSEGIFVFSSQGTGTVTMSNVTSADNAGSGVRADVWLFGDLRILNSIIVNNGEGQIRRPLVPTGTIVTQNTLTGGDVGFEDPALGNYALRSDSVALDAGVVPTDIVLGDFDLLGNARIAGSGLDLGAIERQVAGCPGCAADFDEDGGVTGSDIGAFFIAYEQGLDCADVDANGGVDGGDLAAFFEVFEAGGC